MYVQISAFCSGVATFLLLAPWERGLGLGRQDLRAMCVAVLVFGAVYNGLAALWIPDDEDDEDDDAPVSH